MVMLSLMTVIMLFTETVSNHPEHFKTGAHIEIDNKSEGHGVEVDKYIVFNRNMLHSSISLMWLHVQNPPKMI